MALGDYSAGAAALAGSVLSAKAGKDTNKTNLQIARETNAAQMELAMYQADQNLNLWNLNNEYNTPSAQMARYEAAGLNPNLIYGNGSASSGNSSSPATGFESPRLQRAEMHNPIPNLGQTLMNGLMSVSQIQRNNAETAKTYQNIENLQTDNAIKDLIRINQEYQNSKTKDEAELWYGLLEARIANLDSSTVLNRANAFLADSNRFTSDALRPVLVAQKTAEVDNIIANTVNAKDLHGMNDLRRAQLAADIARIQSQDALNRSMKSEVEKRIEIKNVLIQYGLNLENDELDRLLYQLMNSGASESEITFLKTAGRTATLAGRAMGR